MIAENGVKLNKEQQSAVIHDRGPLIVIAGAGTGKTAVITERIKRIIKKGLARPDEILALTFTEKAAGEMEERVDKALPLGVYQLSIMTFHSFAQKILREEALHIGLDMGFRVMTQAQQAVFIRKNIFAFKLNYFRPLGNPNKFIEGLTMHFSRLKDEDITVERYLKWARNNMEKIKKNTPSISDEDFLEGIKYLELASAYRIYENLKVKNGLMDFSDLISNTLQLFRKKKNILKIYQKKFKYILIDEYQDTNYAQNELAFLLAGKKGNLTVVGDDDQAIYRFRGAAISNIIQFRKRNPQSKLVVLKRNYRSTASILEASYKLIQNNNPDRLECKEKINKKLVSERKIEGERVNYIYRTRVEEEADAVVSSIYSLHESTSEERSYLWKDFAVLVRANNHADPFTRAFTRKGVPCQFLGPGMLFKQPEVKDLIAYLKTLNDTGDSVSFFRVISIIEFGLYERDVYALNAFSKRTGLSLYETCEAVKALHLGELDHWSYKGNYQSGLPFLKHETREKICSIILMFERHFRYANSKSAGQVLYYFLEDSGILKKMTGYENIKDERRVLNISRFFNRLKSLENENEDSSVASVVEWIEMSMELGESPLAADIDWTENDAVNILTVHSAKGLEFPVVYIVNLVSQRFPTNKRRDKIPIPDSMVKEILPEGDYHMQEERRLFYVAMTRARDFLFLTSAGYYSEAKRERKISPFVYEVLPDIFISHSKKEASDSVKGQISIFDFAPKEDKNIDLPDRKIDCLSFSQINSYTTCPLQYKYKYIIKIPVPSSAAASFGSSVHKALEMFFNDVKSGKDVNLKILTAYLDKFWIPKGYRNIKYELKMKKRGREMLKNYYHKYFNSKIKIISLENDFKLKLSGKFMLTGKIDRIDDLGSGRLEIIDYKTGKKPSEKNLKESLQLSVYAMAVSDKGTYGRKLENLVFSFYFLDSAEKVVSVRDKPAIDKAKEKILNVKYSIEEGNFAPRAGSWCDFCDFRMICEAWK